MIVISAALVLLAALLLVVGILWSLTLVYAAIGLAVAGGLVLLVSLFYRPAAASSGDADSQSEPAPDSDSEPDFDSDSDSGFPLEPADADFATGAGATGADVRVLTGRPRYHLAGCRYLEDHDGGVAMEINEARELGFTPCGACRPDETLARGGSPDAPDTR